MIFLYLVSMMGKEIMTFGNTEIEKQKFDHGKNLALLEDLYIDKIQVSSMVSSGEKHMLYWLRRWWL